MSGKADAADGRASSVPLAIGMIVVVLVVLVTAASLAAITATSSGPGEIRALSAGDESTESDGSGGFVGLHDDCDAGDMDACDTLYQESPLGSDEEHFGSTCGNRVEETSGSCNELEALDELYDECDAGDMEACDDLYLESPLGSEEEEFGSTCGGRGSDTYGSCVELDH